MLPPSHGYALSALALNELQSMSPELPGVVLAGSSIEINEHYEGDSEIIFKHAHRLGGERSPHWLKLKNLKAPAVTCKAEQSSGH
jgi:hypothetical protein